MNHWKINGVIYRAPTISRLIIPQLSMYFRPFIWVIPHFNNCVLGAHLVLSVFAGKTTPKQKDIIRICWLDHGKKKQTCFLFLGISKDVGRPRDSFHHMLCMLMIRKSSTMGGKSDPLEPMGSDPRGDRDTPWKVVTAIGSGCDWCEFHRGKPETYGKTTL